MMGEVSLAASKLRQATITEELMDIVRRAEALTDSAQE
jgi:F0F1-type ATP synthase gamma subunit